MSVVRPKAKQKVGGKKPKKDIIGSTAGHLASKQKNHKPKIRSPSAKLGTNKRPAKKKTYTDKELGIPKLNMITPAGVQKPKGKKKGKVYVDDMESMMTIYAMVSAEKEGQIESKMMKARQLEEIREARAKEIDARQQTKRDRIDELKAAARGKKNGKFSSKTNLSTVTEKAGNSPSTKKKVTFADSRSI